VYNEPETSSYADARNHSKHVGSWWSGGDQPRKDNICIHLFFSDWSDGVVDVQNSRYGEFLMVTYQDIRETITKAFDEAKPNHTYEFVGGWIYTNENGTPARIKLKREAIREVKRFLKMNYRYVPNLGKSPLRTLDGLEVMNTIDTGRS
jgi:hypothetical protein